MFMLPLELSLFTYVKYQFIIFVDGVEFHQLYLSYSMLIYADGEEKDLRSFMLGTTPLGCTIGWLLVVTFML